MAEAESEFVDSDGFISDESDFWGDECERDRLEKAAIRPLKRYQPDFPPAFTKRIKSLPSPHKGEKMRVEQKAERQLQTGGDVVEFLKSRPQLSDLADRNSKALHPSTKVQPRTPAGEAAVEIKDVDLFKAHEGDGAWKQSETISEFLRRMPVGDSTLVTGDGWLWVGAPKIPLAHFHHMENSDTGAFVNKGTKLLNSFDNLAAKIKGSNVHKAQSTVSRKIAPHRNELAQNILAVAVKTKTTSGKWMLFPNADDLSQYWQQIATATADGKLGPMAKVATYEPGRMQTLICVYTYHFMDIQDVRRVLTGLAKLGLVDSESRPIYYKCDAYTQLGIESSNNWGLKASLFSSREVLQDEIKALRDGPLSELKKGCDNLC